MAFIDEVEKYFGCRCLYAALDLDKDATEKSIKRAYHKFSLLYHPDRSNGEQKEVNKSKFQTLSKIHSILSNKEQRIFYDENGELLDESDVLSKDRDWEYYWRILFKKITRDDIELFEKEYKGSEKEKIDLKNAYLQLEGDMDQIMENIPCSVSDDESRFFKLIKSWIKDGDVPDFENFSKEDVKKQKKRKRMEEKEAAEADELAKELGINKDGDLHSMILARRGDREKEANNFFSNLEAKYCQKKEKKPSRASSSSSANGKKRKRK